MSLPDIDLSLFFLINQSLRNPVFDAAMPFITRNGPLIVLPFVVWLFAKEKHALWKPLAAAVLSIAFADAASHLLKDLFARPRPCTSLEGVNLLVGCGSSFSMPSNHAANSAAFAFALLWYRRTAQTWLITATALLIGLSRVVVGVHYPSDVVAGIALGIAAAGLSIRLSETFTAAVSRKDYSVLLAIVLAVISAFRIYYIVTGPYDLSPDEAHYWEWSRRLDWSYYSKGPMIAYLIAAGTAVFGNTVLGVRIFAVVASALSSWLLAKTGKDLYDEKTGFYAGLVLQIVPLFSAFGIIFSIDSPLIFFWVFALYLFQRIVLQPGTDNRSFDIRWIMLGIVIGAGMLTKYSVAFFPLSALPYLLASRERRRLLLTPGPYVAATAAAAVFSPVILWNAAQGWVTFKHTAGQAHLQEGLTVSPKAFVEFIGSQFGVITPVLLVLIVVALWRLRKTPQGNYLAWFSFPMIAFFLAKSCQAKVQANWALPSYLSGLVAVSAVFLRDFSRLGRTLKVLVVSALLLAACVSVLPYAPRLLNRLPEKLDPTARLTGWQEIGREVGKIADEMRQDGTVFLFSESYQVASELAFYVPGNPVTYCYNNRRRMNQYDLWPGFETFVGQHAVMVRQTVRSLPPEIEAAFGRCDRQILEIKARRGNRMKFTVFKCYDFKGMQPIEPGKF